MTGGLEQLGWWRQEVLAFLGPDDAWDLATAEVIVRSGALCQRPLGELLPDLPHVCEGAPSDHLESARALNIMRGCSSDTWADLADCSAEGLRTWPNAGRKTVTEIVRTAVRVWEQAAGQPRPPSLENEPATTLTTNRDGSFRRSQQLLLELCSAAYRAGMQDLKEALEFASDGGYEARAAADAWSELGALRLDDLTGLPGGIEEAWQTLLSFNERERRVLKARTFAMDQRTTLGELGENLAVSRERIRQIERGAKEKFQERLASDPACARITHLAARLRRELGSIAPDESVRAALRKSTLPGSDDSTLRGAVLLNLAGPYRFNDGFWQRTTELADMRAALAQRADEPLTEAELDRLLEEAGVVQEHRASCVAALPVRRFDDRILVWNGSLADKAARILRVHGDPMSREELRDAVGVDVNARSLLLQVQDDERFRRMSRDSYGLAEWGGEEYTTIADEIEQAIERRGGRAFLDELVEELVDLFGVSPSSVRSYASSRRFLRQPDGTLAIAPNSHGAKMIPMAPELDQDLVRHRGVWTVHLVVDRDVLRGSGHPVRTAIAQAAGVRPGGARKIQLQNGSVQISWTSNQPALGSTRLIAESLGCEVGDQLFVPLHDGERAVAVRRADLNAAQGLSRLSLELGLSANAELSSIATALGLSADASAADIRTRLCARRQDQLEALVPYNEDTDDDELLAQLIGLGE